MTTPGTNTSPGAKLRPYETLLQGDAQAYTGRSWEVLPSGHVGHRMQVLGLIYDAELSRPTAMFLVHCSCGHQFRMARETVGKALREAE